MSDTYYWASIDAREGRCSRGVIGTIRRHAPADQLGPVWTTEDAEAGRCLLSEVGQKRTAPTETLPVPVIAEPVIAAPDPTGIPPDEESTLDVPSGVLEEAQRRGIPLDNPIKLGFLALELGGEEFMRRNASIYNKLLDIQKERDRDAAASSVDLDGMTLQAFNRMPPIEQDRAILDVLLMLSEDHRHGALERLGMSLADFEALRLASDDMEALRIKQAALADRIAELMSGHRERV